MDGRVMTGDMEDCIAEFIAAWPRARASITSANLLRVGDSMVDIALTKPFVGQRRPRRTITPSPAPYTGPTLVTAGIQAA